MSTSMSGMVEIYFPGIDTWFDVVDAGILMTNNYDVYGCLFGVRNYCNFEPLFPDRGLAPDSSGRMAQLCKELSDEIASVSWCTYEELVQIDLSEKSLEPDSRISVNMTKRLPENKSEEQLREFITRGEVLSDLDFQTLLKIMSALAERYGAENVRLSVYFNE